jgi:hypothetical protein
VATLCTHHEHVSEGLEVVTPGLLHTQMSVDGSVTSGSGQVYQTATEQDTINPSIPIPRRNPSYRRTLVLPVGNVEVGLGVPVLLGQTEIDDVDLVATLADSHKEVVGFDIPVDEVSRVDVLDSGDLYDLSLV